MSQTAKAISSAAHDASSEFLSEVTGPLICSGCGAIAKSAAKRLSSDGGKVEGEAGLTLLIIRKLWKLKVEQAILCPGGDSAAAA